jgi:hypothetical protein
MNAELLGLRYHKPQSPRFAIASDAWPRPDLNQCSRSNPQVVPDHACSDFNRSNRQAARWVRMPGLGRPGTMTRMATAFFGSVKPAAPWQTFRWHQTKRSKGDSRRYQRWRRQSQDHCICYLLLAIREASIRRRVHTARMGRTARMDRIHSDRRLCENRHAYDALFGCRFPLSDATVFGNRGLSRYQSWNR